MNLYIILGFLGSGKTTLLKNLLTQYKNSKNAVIVNDFGKEDIDGRLIEPFAEKMQSIYDGSIFCSCKSDQFVSAVLKMAEYKPDNIFVEASGLANPFTMVNVIDIINRKITDNNKVLLKGVICLVDAVNFEKMLSVAHMVKMQIAISDIIIINKTDCVNNDTVVRIEKTILQINNTAEIIKTVKAEIGDLNVRHIDRELPYNINDIIVQKLMLTLNNGYNLEEIDKICKALSLFSHRIKGVININGNSFIYQFVDGKSDLTPCKDGNSFLIVLSCMKQNLKEKTENIIKDYNFIEIL